LIIDAIYQGILTGKLDQRRQELQVNTTMGRDLRPGQLDDLVGRMTAWADQAMALTTCLQQTAQNVATQVQANEAAKAQYTIDVDAVRQGLHTKQVLDVDMKKDSPARQNEFFETDRGRAKKRQVMEK
jgi:COP9 signalosome complex subunit 7